MDHSTQRLVAGGGLVTGGLALAVAIADPAKWPLWVRWPLFSLGVLLALLGVTITWPLLSQAFRRWRAYHFPKPNDYGSGPLVLRVTKEKTQFSEYDEERREGYVTVENILVRNERREPLDHLSIRFAFHPAAHHARAPGHYREVGPEYISLPKRGWWKRGKCSIPQLRYRIGSISRTDYINGSARLWFCTTAGANREHVEDLVSDGPAPSLPTVSVDPGERDIYLQILNGAGVRRITAAVASVAHPRHDLTLPTPLKWTAGQSEREKVLAGEQMAKLHLVALRHHEDGVQFTFPATETTPVQSVIDPNGSLRLVMCLRYHGPDITDRFTVDLTTVEATGTLGRYWKVESNIRRLPSVPDTAGHRGQESEA